MIEIGRRGIAIALVCVFALPTARSDADTTDPLRRALLAPETESNARLLAAAELQKSEEGRAALTDALANSRGRPEVVTAILASLQRPDECFLVPLLDLHARTEDAALRQQTRIALGRIEGDAVARAIVARASNSALDGARRRDSLAVLGQLGSWRQVGALLELYEAQRDERGSSILGALQQITRLDWDAEQMPRWRALWLELAPLSDAAAYRAILAALEQRQQARLLELEQEVARYLDPTDAKQNVLALASALPGIRALAAGHLVDLATRDPKQHREACAAALLDRLAHETHPAVNAELARGAGVLELKEAEPHLRKQLQFVESAHSLALITPADRQALAFQLVRALGSLRSNVALDSMAAIAHAAWATEEIRIACVRAFGKIGGTQAFELLAAQARDNPQAGAPLLGAIAEVLGDFPESCPQLVQLLDHEHPDVRSRAADSLGKLGPKLAPEAAAAAVDRLAFHLLARNDPPYVRAAAGLALGEMHAAAGVAPLVKALRADDDNVVRRRAAEALQRLGLAETVPPLEEALDDPHADVAEAAWLAIGVILPPDALMTRVDEWFERGQHAALARRTFEQTLAKTPVDQVATRFALETKIARCELREGRRESARDKLAALLAKAPDDRALSLWLTDALIADGAPAADLDAARSIVAKFPDVPADELGWRAAARRVAIELGRDPKSARAAYDKLVALNPALGGPAVADDWSKVRARLDPPPK